MDVRAEMIDIKTDRQALEQQMKDTLAQLHASQLECQILKNQGEIEGADMIRRRLVLIEVDFTRLSDVVSF